MTTKKRTEPDLPEDPARIVEDNYFGRMRRVRSLLADLARIQNDLDHAISEAGDYLLRHEEAEFMVNAYVKREKRGWPNDHLHPRLY